MERERESHSRPEPCPGKLPDSQAGASEGGGEDRRGESSSFRLPSASCCQPWSDLRAGIVVVFGFGEAWLGPSQYSPQHFSWNKVERPQERRATIWSVLPTAAAGRRMPWHIGLAGSEALCVRVCTGVCVYAPHVAGIRLLGRCSPTLSAWRAAAERMI